VRFVGFHSNYTTMHGAEHIKAVQLYQSEKVMDKLENVDVTYHFWCVHPVTASWV
jgi:hypothetical protein